MPQALTYPGVYVEEVSSGVRTITGVATSIALFVGWAGRGPVDAATRILSFADFERKYGGLDTRSFLGYAVRDFFNNGGTDAYVVRIAPTTTGETPNPDAPVPATAAIGSLAVTASSPGEWGNKYGVRIVQRPDDAARFKLEVTLGDPTDDAVVAQVVEVFENMSTTATDSRFVETVVNGRSQIVTVTVAATPVADVEAPLEDGADGEVLEADDDVFTTALADLFDVGGAADKLDIFNLVCVPGLTAGDHIATLRANCAKKRAFLIVDSKEGATLESVQDDLDAMAGGDMSYGALYYPRVRAGDPLQSGAVRSFPSCGIVAGIYARTDARRGVWKAPAGTDAAINGIVGLEQTLSDAENGVLNPLAINCLRTMPVYGNIVWGARTMEGNNDRGSEWKYVPVRRLALFLEESLYRGTQWVVFEPNDEPLWSQIRLNVGAFMQSLFREGAFQGTTPREAYFVKCDRTTTTQDDINRGVVNIHVGFAPLKPAEFVILRIQQIAGELAT
ncbi:MAG TPA: phage tail sheath C-terminal domain-containing protein [Steroidobacteraceae bacterium]|nr:phage tail sheath C-terminal domain-containing protein [Steroidobacteraceae bacterium]